MRLRRARETAPEEGPSAAELARATRRLALRTRREVQSPFAGAYLSAFRGSGYEFEESRPYVPGDDVRTLDWSALARTGSPWVKRYREERDQTVILAVDVSSSMQFGSAGRSQAATAAHAAALIAGAANRARDRVGLLTFDDRIRDEILPARGEGHRYHLVRRLVEASRQADGGTDVGRALDRLLVYPGRRAILVLLSDFREPGSPATPGASEPGPRAALVALARRHDLVAAILHDPRDEEIPAVGVVRVRDPEAEGPIRTWSTRRPQDRERYRLACLVRRRALERRLRADGADVVWLRNDRDPLHAWMTFFRSRGSRAGSLA